MGKKPIDVERGERIRYIREDVLGISSQDDFARALGVKRGAVGNWELGGGIKLENIKKIAELYRMPFNWIATGIGERPVAGDAVNGRSYVPIEELENSGKPQIDASYTREHYVPKISGGIPEIDGGLGAGEGRDGEVLVLEINGDSYSGHRVVTEWLLSENFIRNEARASVGSSIVFPVTGDSMFPSYNIGDRVVIDLSQDEFLQDAVYVISDGESAPRIKRLHLVFKSNPRRVRIISDNPIYPPEEHLLGDVKIVGRVCGVIARR